jgi:hypothetical protein
LAISHNCSPNLSATEAGNKTKPKEKKRKEKTTKDRVSRGTRTEFLITTRLTVQQKIQQKQFDHCQSRANINHQCDTHRKIEPISRIKYRRLNCQLVRKNWNHNTREKKKKK